MKNDTPKMKRNLLQFVLDMWRIKLKQKRKEQKRVFVWNLKTDKVELCGLVGNWHLKRSVISDNSNYHTPTLNNKKYKIII